MKKHFIYLALLFLINTLSAQRYDEFMQDPDYDDIYSSKGCYVNCNNGTEVENFKFSTLSFSNALTNQILLERAQKANMRAWFNDQKNIIKGHLETKLGKSFASYDDAKDAMFLKSEERNIAINTPIVINQYATKQSIAKSTQKTLVKNLKLLTLREAELQSGSYATVKYPYVEVNGTALKDMTSLINLRVVQSLTTAVLSNNAVNLHKASNVHSLLQQIGANEDFEDEIIDLKNSYYNSFNDWDELNYMQFLINYDEIKRLSSPPYYYPELITTFKKFTDTDKATTEAIENYALENHTGGRSVFDEGYFMDVFEEKKHEYNPFTQTLSSFLNEMKAIAAQRKEAALQELLNSLSTTDIAIENLIGQLNITDADQKKWLYANTNEALNIITFIEENSYRGNVSDEAEFFVINVIEALTNKVEINVDENLISNDTSISALLAKNSKGKLVYITNNDTTIIKHESGLVALVEKGFLITNNKTKIPVFKNLDKENICFKTNCHGETFADGSFWIDNTSVDKILLNDGYHVINKLSDIVVGDVLVYIENSLVVHSVTVVQSDGTISGLIVKGLGGIETETTTENFRNAWSSANNIEVYRKLGSNIILTNEEIEQIRKDIYGN